MIKGMLGPSLILAVCALLSIGSAMASEFDDFPPLEPKNETRLIGDDGFVAECLSEIFSSNHIYREKGNIVNFLVTRSDKFGYVLRLDFQREAQKQFVNRIMCWQGPNHGLGVMTAIMVKPLDKRE
jgi:hypothetical protein